MLKPESTGFVVLFVMLMALSCSGPDSDQPLLTAELPLHLEAHINDAKIVGSEVPEDLPVPVVWNFDEPQPDWKPVKPLLPESEGVKPVRVDDALRLPLTLRNLVRGEPVRFVLGGSIHIELPDWDLKDWAYVEIRARSQDAINLFGLYFNYTEKDPGSAFFPFYSVGDQTPLVTDGTVQTYRLSLDSPKMKRMRTLEGPWTHLGIWFSSQLNEEAVTLDILSVRIIPKEHIYADAPAGVRTVECSQKNRHTLYTHAPGRIEYRVRIPLNGRLDVGLGVLRENTPVTFRVSASRNEKEEVALFEEAYSNHSEWAQRSVDLTSMAGETVRIALETKTERSGAVAFWSAPTLTGKRSTKMPSIIFYVIDGAGAEYMSLYGYNRRTTPNIDRLAAEGAVFERAYSNSSWTLPSTASFMTSLQHSVLGGQKAGFNVVPEDALTMAQHFHRAGYQTGVFTPNPNAGTRSGLDREVDVFQEDWEGFTYTQSGHWREGSRYLHDAFWTWREDFPGEPYWVHFQPVDIHSDFPEVAPFGGLFVSPEQAKVWMEWEDRLEQERDDNPYSEVWEETGIDRVEFYTVAQGMYDEAMAYTDYQIGRLVERLKAQGEWENTLLIVAADHSIDAAMQDMAIAIQDSLPPAWNQPMLRPSITRIPLLFVWSGHIAGGQRFSEPMASMVDVLPTILDLAGLPLPEVMQGRSLAPLLLGKGEVEPRPVILDESWVDSQVDGEFRGVIEVIDGRWGASLEVNPRPPKEDEPEEEAMYRRPVPLLLYDLWNDPYCLHSIHEERPDLVEKYKAFLEAQFEAHRALAKMFTPSKALPLTPQQLEALRSLGYIR
jgi:arylsulfatase A-like enzyme